MPRIRNACRTFLASAVLAAAMGIANAAVIGPSSPSIVVNVDGTSVNVSLRQGGKLYVSDFTGPLEVGGPNGAILTSLDVRADPDPFLGYAIGVTDIGTPSLFGFAFATPIVSTSPPGTVTSSFSATLTAGVDGGISITPAAPGVPDDADGIPEIHVVNDGFPLTNDGRDLGPGATSAGAHGPFNEVGPMPGPGPWTWLQINVTFLGSGGSDLYQLIGSAVKVETAQVPEPSTLLLTLAALAGCARSRRLRMLTR